MVLLGVVFFFWPGGGVFSGAVGTGLSRAGRVAGFSYAVGTAGNLGLPGRGPISWEEMGKEPGEEVLPGTPFSGGGCMGEAVPLTGYLACGPHSERPVAARPPAGRAGDVAEYPLGEGERGTSWNQKIKPPMSYQFDSTTPEVSGKNEEQFVYFIFIAKIGLRHIERQCSIIYYRILIPIGSCCNPCKSNLPVAFRQL